jgi:hypothetical protein
MAGSLQEATVTALKAHPPFDQMGSKSLNFLAARLQLAYYPRGAVVLAPESGAVQNLYILKQGRVRGSAAGALPGAGDVTVGAGNYLMARWWRTVRRRTSHGRRGLLKGRRRRRSTS